LLYTGFDEKEINLLISAIGENNQPFLEKEFDENIKVSNKCPKCDYEW